MKLNIFRLLILLTFSLVAQHCPFDNKGLLVVKVEIKNSDKHFEFLQPILTYTNEKNIKVRKELYKNKPSTNDYLRKQNAYDIAALHFDFAANYFVTEIPIQELKNSIIHLEDENGKIVGEKYVVKQEDKFNLHKNYFNTWYKFTEKFTPKPLNSFKQLITLKVNYIEKINGILLKKMHPKLNQKYHYKNRIVFHNQKELEEVFLITQPKYKNIDFSKKVVIYQRFVGDCKMKVHLFKATNMQEHNITIKSYQYYGRCRASGKKEFLSILDKPEKGSKLLFKNLYYEDFEYNKF